MISIEAYLKNPCGSYSLPYHKQKKIVVPKHILIYHESTFEKESPSYLSVKKYFRMKHDLRQIEQPRGLASTIQIEKDLHALKDHINACYAHESISIELEDLMSWQKKEVYHHNLWVKIEHQESIIASGIAEYDEETKEGILEWIQVDPKYQNLGYGKEIVLTLLKRLKEYADFVTVSGHLDNQTHPKRIYERCGFEGRDVWYILEV